MLGVAAPVNAVMRARLRDAAHVLDHLRSSPLAPALGGRTQQRFAGLECQ